MAACILSAVSVCMPAKAAAYDADREGSITIQLEDIGTDMSGVEFYCYRIAEPSEDGEGIWKMLPLFEASGVDIGSLITAGDYRRAAEKLAGWENKNRAEYVLGKTNEEGTVSFKQLKQGVYLLEQTDRGCYGAVAPFLIAVPYTEGGQEWNYDIQMNTKGEHVPEEPGKDEPEHGSPAQNDSHVQNGSPAQTGDASMPEIYVILAIAAGLGIAGTIRYKQEK